MPSEPNKLPACPGCAERDQRIAALEARMGELERKLQEALRSGRRQSAPFSKGPPKAEPRPSGRKAGPEYGTPSRRAIPETVDEVHEAKLPPACPSCGGSVLLTHTAGQYQVEIPRRPVYRRIDVHVGCCRRCGRRVQGRHALQTSDALGACASQLGPDAQAAAVHLNKRAGLSHGKVADVFATLFGIDLSAGGSCQAVLRAGRRAEGNYRSIVGHVKNSAYVVPDETGWRVGGVGAWLHAFATPTAAAYLIDPERGSEASAKVLGRDYAGLMTHDGWAAYRRFFHATHQLCLAHLLRRCDELLDVATRGAVNFPRAVKAILKEGLSVRDDRDAGSLAPDAAAAKADELQRRMAKLVGPVKANKPNETFAKHLQANLRHLFTFLRHPGVDATNWRAEQAIRPAVVNRKVWGGNRTAAGAHAQSVLMSVLQTAKLRGRDSMAFLSGLLCAPAEQRPLLLTA
jgi:transposase